MMKRNSRIYVTILAVLLSCAGLVSVGFASWIISQETDPVSVTGDINADTVDTNIDGLSISGSPMRIAHYHYDDGNSNYSDIGYLTYSIDFDVSEIDKNLLNNNIMTLSGSLSFGTGLAIFKSDYVESITYDSSAVSYNFITGETAIEFTISQTIGNSDINDKELVFAFNNKMIAKYGASMAGDAFYLRLEVE